MNLAGRMESTGEADRIQVSAETAERLAGRFALAERGPVALKGYGERVTWFLEGARAAAACRA